MNVKKKTSPGAYHSILLKTMPDDMGDRCIGGLLEELYGLGSGELGRFAWEYARSADRDLAASAIWPGEAGDSFERFVDEALEDARVCRFLMAYEAAAGCPDCGRRRDAERMAGRIFWHECSACRKKARFSAWVSWKEAVRSEWERLAFEAIGEEHWPSSYPLVGAVKRFLDRSHPSWGVYLHGPPGTGKTQQAVEVIRACLEERVGTYGPDAPERFHGELRPFPPIVFAKEAEMIASLRPNREGIERYKRAELLILDDLGVSKASDWSYETLTMVIDYRHDQHLPTLFTSNLDLASLRAGGMYDERLTQRIFKMCGGMSSYRDGSLAMAEMTECYRMDGAAEGLW